MRTRAIDIDQALRRPSVQRFHLVVLRGPKPGEAFELQPETTSVGKGEDCDVVLADATVSRNHFQIINDGQGYLVRDLGSTNGTWLEDSRIKEAYLKPGAKIKAGEVLLRFQPVSEAVDVVPSESGRFVNMVSDNPETRRIFSLLEKVAPSMATILLHGETGAGKGATARAIHDASDRRDGPFTVMDCGAVSKTLIESELFGHERGAFTGATQLRRGAMEASQGGTLFIDELDDLPLELQPKLLRSLDEKVIYRVGSHKPIKLDVRVVAATKKDLRTQVAEGRFREDLYFRVSVVTVPLPPLRDRIEDIPLLVDHFLERKGAFDDLPKEVSERLLAHTWPGNIRELRNVLERAMYTGELSTIDPAMYATAPRDAFSSRLRLDYSRPFKEAKEALVTRFEREYIRQLLSRTGGNMAKAAREAGIDRKYLYMLMKKHDMSPGEFS